MKNELSHTFAPAPRVSISAICSILFGVGVFAGVSQGQVGGVSFGSPTVVSNDTALRLLADVNQDGRLDIIGDQGLALALAGGGFSAVQPYPGSLVDFRPTGAGDLNGDGIGDVVGLASPSKMQVLIYDGVSSFSLGFSSDLMTFPVTWFPPASARVVDLDSDGDLDILACAGNLISWHGILDMRRFSFLNDGKGSFSLYETPVFSTWIRDVADANGDGNLDWVTTWWDAQFVPLIHGNGFGGSTSTSFIFTNWGPQGACFGNIDGDGIPDVAIGMYDLLGDVPPGARVWLSSTGSVNTWDQSLGGPNIYDVGGDGWGDVIFPGTETWALTSLGGGSLTNPFALPATASEAIDFADLDGDGRVDLLYPSGSTTLQLPSTAPAALPHVPWIASVGPWASRIAAPTTPILTVRGSGLAEILAMSIGSQNYVLPEATPLSAHLATIVLAPPPSAGVVEVSAFTPAGTSVPFRIPLRLASTPVVVVGPQQLSPGSPVTIGCAGPNPGDLVLLLASSCATPLSIAPYVDFAIGGCGDITFVDMPGPLDASGLSLLSGTVPPTLHGTMYLQYAAVNIADLMANHFPFATSGVLTINLP
ncbi:MAG: FG-GAP repeat domain-containing protein [Planctomycetota bacterium]